MWIQDPTVGGTLTEQVGVDIDALSNAVANIGFRNRAVSRLVGAVMVGADASPATSAILELQTTTGAFLPTRLTTTQRNAMTPVDGMIIYNTTTGVTEAREGGAWVNL